MAAVFALAAASTLVKLLFIKAYRSTDFEVHRNWLAITHSLPVRKWYFEETSEWTLDYPPLFAAFEWLMSHIARLFDPEMLVVSNLNYASERTIIFQRLSVIFTDFVFFYAVNEFCKSTLVLNKTSGNNDIEPLRRLVIPVQLIFNFGLFIVDHIHFQYNGILFGFLLMSITSILKNQPLEGAFWFAVLLNMKHIYMYVAPAYFIYLLRTYCFKLTKPVSMDSFLVSKLIRLGALVAFVFIVSFGPYIYMGQFSQVLSRLFPFKRGLMHAYWAPNFWALYTTLDKLLSVFAVKLKLINPANIPAAAMTGGMVQEYKHLVLPSVPPLVTLLFTVIAIAPALCSLWQKKTPEAFLKTVILCAYSSFIFGWHVHEKAILLITIPMTLLIISKKDYASLYLILTTAGYYSLFPLLFTPFENMLKVVLFVLNAVWTYYTLGAIYSINIKEPKKKYSATLKFLKKISLPLLSPLESLYVWGFVPLALFNSAGVWLLGLDSRLPFLPLMLTSVYCAVGVIYTWLLFYSYFLENGTTPVKGKGSRRRKVSDSLAQDDSDVVIEYGSKNNRKSSRSRKSD